MRRIRFDLRLKEELESLREKYGESDFRRALKFFSTEKSRNLYKRKKFSRSVVRRVLLQQSGLCFLCGESLPLSNAEGDHWDSSLSGPELNSEKNCRVLCRKCNRTKSSKSLYAVAKERGKTVLETISAKEGGI